MIANVENTIEWLRLNGLKYFVVQLKDSDNTRVFESDDKKTFEDNIAVFRQVMDVSYGSRFIIKAADSKESKRGKFADEFKNIGSEALPTIGTAPNLGVYGTTDIETIVQKRIDEYEAKQELIRLKQERDDYKREAERRETIQEQFMERTLPYVGTLANYFVSRIIPAKAPIALAGLEHEPETEQTHELMNEEIELTEPQTDRVEAALQKWAKADADFITLLEKIADMAHAKDQMYNMAKNMLK